MADSVYQIEKVTYGDGRKRYYITRPDGTRVQEWLVLYPEYPWDIECETLWGARRTIRKMLKKQERNRKAQEIKSKEIIK